MIVNAPSIYGYGVAGPLSEQFLEFLIREYGLPITFPETRQLALPNLRSTHFHADKAALTAEDADLAHVASFWKIKNTMSTSLHRTNITRRHVNVFLSTVDHRIQRIEPSAPPRLLRFRYPC